MKRILCAVLAVGLASVLTAAQEIDRKSRTKVTVEDGKDVTVTGCVQRAAEGGFVLTHAAGKEGVLGTYILAALDDDEDELEDLDEHIGHRVEVKGKAADQGDGKIKVETKREVDTPDGERVRRSRSEVEGDLKGLPYLGVDSVRMLATVCP